MPVDPQNSLHSIQRQPRVVVIGRTQAVECAELLLWLRQSALLRLVGTFSTIAEACADASTESSPFDIAIVLQSTSDEYTAAGANKLIGSMLFGRVMCCYGPWCQSDGRSHDIWPVSTRIPLSTARAVLSGELAGFQTDQPALLPLSAAEEVFAHRMMTQSWAQAATAAQRFILIITDEWALRDSLLKMCRQFEWSTVTAAVDVESVTTAIQRLRRDFNNIGRLEIIIDLDPLDARCLDVLRLLRTEIPDEEGPRTSFVAMTVFGMTVFPESSLSQNILKQANLTAVIDKTELLIRMTDELTRG
jgi:CheY-like chemotaxis protein